MNPLLGALDRVLYLGRGHAALGTVDEVITGPVLSRLYGSDDRRVRLNGRIFVMSGGHDMEHDEHRHERRRMRMARTERMPTMLDYDFMRNAFAAAAVVALVAGMVGYFLVLRGQTFAGHALAHVGFTGATGAVLVGVAPLWGLVLMTVAAGIGMGFDGRAPGAARRGDRPGAGAFAWLSACCSCISSPPMRRRRRRCCSATCWRWMCRPCGRCWRSAA